MILNHMLALNSQVAQQFCQETPELQAHKCQV